MRRALGPSHAGAPEPDESASSLSCVGYMRLSSTRTSRAAAGSHSCSAPTDTRSSILWISGSGTSWANGLYRRSATGVWANGDDGCTLEQNTTACRWSFTCRGKRPYVSDCHSVDPSLCRFRVSGHGNPPAPKPVHVPEATAPTVGRNCTPTLPPSPVSAAVAASAPVRVIWIFWAQGWDKAPSLARACSASWARVNPTWQVRRLSLDDLSSLGVVPLNSTTASVNGYRYRPRLLSPHYSDLVRVELLHLYGGLWVDATVFCVLPIESWLPIARPDDASAGGVGSVDPWRAFFGVRYGDASLLSGARGHGLFPEQVYNWLLYPTPRPPMTHVSFVSRCPTGSSTHACPTLR